MHKSFRFVFSIIYFKPENMKKITTRNLCLRAAVVFFFLFLITSWTLATDNKATVNYTQLVSQTLYQFN